MTSSLFRTAFPTISFALCLAGAALPLHAGAQSVPQEGVRRISFEKSRNEPYALVRNGQRTTFVDSYHDDSDEVDALKGTYGDHFIWFRQAGIAYVVRDAATVADVEAAWASTDKLGLEMKKFDAQMRIQSDAMAALSRDMETATRGDKAGRGAMDAVGKRMEAHGQTMDALGKQMNALGKQIDRESKLADAATRSLLQKARANGAAQPVPPKQ